MLETMLRSVREANVTNKRVLLRTSLNVPLGPDGSVEDVYRLQSDVATIELLATLKAKIILIGYIGREGGTLAPVAKALQAVLPNIQVVFTSAPLEHVHEDIELLEPGHCLMLENIRQHPGEEKNDPELAQQLASLADVFVDDAFAEAHRAYASNVGVATLLPSYAGLLMEEEVEHLHEALVPLKGSLAIVGGAKFETKLPLLKKLLGLYEEVLVGGALANDLLKARGRSVGMSLVSDYAVPKELVEEVRLLAPEDVRIEEGVPEGVLVGSVGEKEKIIDIGAITEKKWAEKIAGASFVLWNGPMGVYEKGDVFGTDALAEALVKATCKAVIGGGDTAAALAQFTFDPSRIFVSTGGGAMLEFLTNGGSMPAIEVLEK